MLSEFSWSEELTLDIILARHGKAVANPFCSRKSMTANWACGHDPQSSMMTKPPRVAAQRTEQNWATSTCWKNWLKWETLQPYAAIVPSNAAISRDETIETIETDPKSPRAQGPKDNLHIRSHSVSQIPGPISQPVGSICSTVEPCWIWPPKKKGPEVAYSLLHNCNFKPV